LVHLAMNWHCVRFNISLNILYVNHF